MKSSYRPSDAERGVGGGGQSDREWVVGEVSVPKSAFENDPPLQSLQ
jgi:hypothetical protein